MPATDPSETEARAATKGGGKPRIRRSLLDLSKPQHGAADSGPDQDRPLQLTEGKTPSLSLGIVTDDMEFVFPWIAFQVSARMGEQYTVAIGEYELTLLIDNKRANERGWATPAQDISNGIHTQTISWIHHRPDWGLTLEIAKRNPEEGGEDGG